MPSQYGSSMESCASSGEGFCFRFCLSVCMLYPRHIYCRPEQQTWVGHDKFFCSDAADVMCTLNSPLGMLSGGTSASSDDVRCLLRTPAQTCTLSSSGNELFAQDRCWVIGAESNPPDFCLCRVSLGCSTAYPGNTYVLASRCCQTLG